MMTRLIDDFYDTLKKKINRLSFIFIFLQTGANAGHYTTFAKHPLNGQWYYYNDESVSQQSPKKEDFKNAYILFYSRQGMNQSAKCITAISTFMLM